MNWHLSMKNHIFPFVLTSLTIFQSSQLPASEAGNGVVNMEGVIVERPCAIDVGDSEQVLTMDEVPVSQIVRDGRGPQKSFTIQLVDCVLQRLDPDKPDWQTFSVTFNGENDQGYFGLSGDARGIALAITDEAGNLARPGYVMSPAAIIPDEMLLRYNVNLVGNLKTLQAGDYQAAIRFTMAYN